MKVCTSLCVYLHREWGRRWREAKLWYNNHLLTNLLNSVCDEAAQLGYTHFYVYQLQKYSLITSTYVDQN